MNRDAWYDAVPTGDYEADAREVNPLVRDDLEPLIANLQRWYDERRD